MAAGSMEEYEESRLLLKRKIERESWLIEMVREEDAPQPQSGSNPPLHIVPDTLRNHGDDIFYPQVVSLGLYHLKRLFFRVTSSSRRDQLEGYLSMDCHKRDAVGWFVSLSPGPANANSEDKVIKIYDDFVIKASQDSYYRGWYADGEWRDDEIMYVMFLDGCFILHFVYLSVKKPETRNPYLDQVPFIVRDMLLLQNQIPYPVLKCLMDLMPDPKPLTKRDIRKFFKFWILPKYGSLNFWSSIRGEPLHLLDILRTNLIGGPVDTSHRYDGYCFRSIAELKAAWIKLRRSHSSNLNKIEFNHDLIGGWSLSLPQMIIDDMTKALLLNLIAYEMCPGCPPDPARVITSYICFLGSLIYDADGVKELRSRGILLSALSNDEEVVKLFKELTISLVPDPRIYADAINKIESYCSSRVRVRWGEMLNTYFSSPWTAISLVAAILLLFLTVVQTIFTVW